MYNPEMFERNLGLMSSSEQGRINDSSVAIAGAGGDGGLLAIMLVRMGFGEVRLADPEVFDVENINRQAACTVETIGTNKAVAVGRTLLSINPDLSLKVFSDGITPENTHEFVRGADLVIDETEYTQPELGVMLARQARSEGTPVLTALNLGFGSLVTTFKPEGVPLERVLGLSTDASLDEIKQANVPLSRWLPYIPPYADIKVFEKVASGEKSAPSVAPGVALAAGLGSTQAFLNIVRGNNNRPDPVYARRALVSDAMTGQSKMVRFNRAYHYAHLAPLLARNLLKRNPEASY